MMSIGRGRRVQPLLWASLLLVPLLAGCVASDEAAPAGAADAGDGAQAPRSFQAIPADKASVSGKVVSDDFEPVAGAEVVIQELELNTTTDRDGRYAFELVQPGRYRMFAQAEGFGVNLTEVHLVGGQLVGASFILPTLPREVPHTVLLEQSGFIECAWGTPVLTGNCIPLQFLFDQLGTNPTGTVSILKWDFERDALLAVVIELIWDSPFDGTTARELLLIAEADGSGPIAGEEYGRTSGPPVVRLELTGETLPTPDEGGTTGRFQTRVFPPFAAGEVTFQQKYTVFMSLFYHRLPGPGYTAIPDGF